MSHNLKVFLYDELLLETTLQAGEEYVLGRDESCDFVLNDKTISRQHLKFFSDGVNWYVQCLSRLGNLIDSESGEARENLQIKSSGSEFSVNNYIFKVSPSDENSLLSESSYEEERSLADGLIDSDANTDNINFGDSEDDAEKTNFSKSQGSISHLQAYLRVSIPGNPDDEVKLQGREWVIGRTDECEITIPEPVISRTHFRITKSGTVYYIEDLYSSNGTILNGDALKPHQPTPIESGDRLSIKEIRFSFEIRDSRFEKQMQVLSDQIVSHVPDTGIAPPPGAVRVPPPSHYAGNSRKKAIRIGAILVAVFAIGYSFTDSTGTKQSASSISKTEPESPKSTLTKEQTELVEVRYKSAEKFMRESKYELALTELQKIHELVPQYKESKTMEGLAQNSIDTLKEIEDLERVKEQQQKVKRQANSIVEQCRKRSLASPNVINTQQCLESAMEIDPENMAARNLLQDVDKRARELQARQKSKANYARSVRLGESQYRTAKRLHDKGKLLDAKTNYKRHIASSYPDPKNLKSKSKRALQSLNSQIDVKMKSLSSEIETAIAAGDHKRAILSLRQALSYEPGNIDIEDQITIQLRELNKKSRVLFQDARLEEGLGNIESAKKKWEKIIETDLPTGDYYKKAKSKIKKYGL